MLQGVESWLQEISCECHTLASLKVPASQTPVPCGLPCLQPAIYAYAPTVQYSGIEDLTFQFRWGELGRQGGAKADYLQPSIVLRLASACSARMVDGMPITALLTACSSNSVQTPIPTLWMTRVTMR